MDWNTVAVAALPTSVAIVGSIVTAYVTVTTIKKQNEAATKERRENRDYALADARREIAVQPFLRLVSAVTEIERVTARRTSPWMDDEGVRQLPVHERLVDALTEAPGYVATFGSPATRDALQRYLDAIEEAVAEANRQLAEAEAAEAAGDAKEATLKYAYVIMSYSMLPRRNHPEDTALTPGEAFEDIADQLVSSLRVDVQSFY
ncbi:hypothetical protein JL108_14475 [Aeromicrobium sp. YIM 150415]|uniref:hypothetical protein n=1 Tax=Aeromicrobium sp. YIM 150415 TaxID=2803912 RepID=UPI0019639227|nr:hypothetical protein [Aeromicrobium sp. YIM 150415]MBM9464659.1 hypothetical protein [Aeromicrobium sp. YIM 150415]